MFSVQLLNKNACDHKARSTPDFMDACSKFEICINTKYPAAVTGVGYGALLALRLAVCPLPPNT